MTPEAVEKLAAEYGFMVDRETVRWRTVLSVRDKYEPAWEIDLSWDQYLDAVPPSYYLDLRVMGASIGHFSLWFPPEEERTESAWRHTFELMRGPTIQREMRNYRGSGALLLHAPDTTEAYAFPLDELSALHAELDAVLQRHNAKLLVYSTRPNFVVVHRHPPLQPSEAPMEDNTIM